jgi:hypothetical protein
MTFPRLGLRVIGFDRKGVLEAHSWMCATTTIFPDLVTFVSKGEINNHQS